MMNPLDLDILFTECLDIGLGSRLGIPFMRAQLDSIELSIRDISISLRQSQSGHLAISGVVCEN